MRCPSRTGDGGGYGVFSEAGLVAQAGKSFALIAFCACPRFVTALTKTLSGYWGGRYPPGSALASILPGRSLLLAGECPLYARAIVILF